MACRTVADTDGFGMTDIGGPWLDGQWRTLACWTVADTLMALACRTVANTLMALACRTVADTLMALACRTVADTRMALA